MKFLRNRRRLALLGVVAAAMGVTLALVLPALASPVGASVGPPSNTRGITPTDANLGGSSTCTDLGFSGTEYDISTPKTTPANKPLALGNGVTLAIKMDPGDAGPTISPAYTKDKYFNFTLTGAALVGLGVKGGTDTTKYVASAFTKGTGPVTSDTYLHAPAQSWTGTDPEVPTQLYSVSQLTFCYTVLSYIEGTVYQDADQSGGQNSGTPADSVFPDADNWTVRLYKDGTQIDQQATTSGKYHFDLPVDGSTYRVCEVPGSTSPSPGDTWVESQPNPSTTIGCTGSNESLKGYEFKPTSGAGQSNDDFGNVPGYSCDSAGSSLGIAPYTVGECKGGQLYVFNSGTTTFNNKATPFVDYWVADPTKPQVPVVEQINFDDPIDPTSGLPTYTKLLYADGGQFPVNLNNLITMQYCKVDPRDGTDFGISQSYDENSTSESGAVLPGTNTSCVISIKITAPPNAGGVGKLQAYVYALGDPVRGAG